MKRVILSAGILLAMTLFAQAQKTETAPPPPPRPPKVSSNSTEPPPPPPPKVEMRKFTPPTIISDEENEFMQRNKDVASVRYRPNNRIVINKKDKTKEEYNMKDPAQKKKFTEKYGEAPTLPPPPPPPAPPVEKKS